MDSSKQLKIGLFINARDEDNLKEWVTHHLLLGFNKIIIFDHKSIIPIKSLLKCLLLRAMLYIVVIANTEIATYKNVLRFVPVSDVAS